MYKYVYLPDLSSNVSITPLKITVPWSLVTLWIMSKVISSKVIHTSNIIRKEHLFCLRTVNCFLRFIHQICFDLLDIRLAYLFLTL